MRASSFPEKPRALGEKGTTLVSATRRRENSFVLFCLIVGRRAVRRSPLTMLIIGCFAVMIVDTWKRLPLWMWLVAWTVGYALALEFRILPIQHGGFGTLNGQAVARKSFLQILGQNLLSLLKVSPLFLLPSFRQSSPWLLMAKTVAFVVPVAFVYSGLQWIYGFRRGKGTVRLFTHR